MATSKHSSSEPVPSGSESAAEALRNIERPKVRWKVIAQFVVAFAVIWVLGFMAVPYVGFWGVGVAGVLTLVALGFGIYVLRLTRKSAAIVDILKGATDKEGREAALARLQAKGDSGDALSALAQAQLMAQQDPAEAMAILERVDLKKAPAMVQDDVRANLALLYLVHGKAKNARELADQVRIDRAQGKAKGLYAAVIAEAFARTGKAEEARTLLETYSAHDPEYADSRVMLLRANVYACMACKKRGLAKKALQELASVDPGTVVGFVQKGAHPELRQMARDILSRAGVIPKTPKIRRV